MLNRVVFMLMGVVGVLCAFATGGGGGRGSQNRPGSGNNFIRGPEFQRRGLETMTGYYQRMSRTPGSGVTATRNRTRGANGQYTPPFRGPSMRY